MAQTTVYEIVTEEIVKLLEEGTVPWHRPWDAAVCGLPQSMSTGNAYRGVNVFLLEAQAMAHGYASPWWGTYKHIGDLGGQVRKGERSTLVVFWKKGRRELTEEDKAAGKRAEFMILRYFRVFNAEQADGLPERFYAKPERPFDFDPLAECEAIVAGYEAGPAVQQRGAAAYYSPSADVVVTPGPAAFESADAYYSTLFHELTHSTGHASRLARPTLLEHHRFGDESYSREELVAEMGAAMLSGVAGIHQRTVGQSAAYLASWVKALKGDAKLIVQAAGQAQRAADRILGRTYEDGAAVA